MSRKLPPLNPLRTFEAAARHGSFTRAAEELLVSQSAVSRQIGVLEGYLGLQLFVRDSRGTRLTPAGEQYFAEIGPAFQLLATATDRLRRSTGGAPLKIKVYATFAAKWLMRRLPRFQALYPEIGVRISTAVTPVDFARDQVDAAIQLGRGNWPGGEAVFLFGDEIAPVCAPALLAGRSPPLPLAELAHFRLLHSHYRHGDWPDWLRAVGAPAAAEGEPMVFPSSLLTYQAAVDGLGMAMGQPLLLQEELAAGALVRPFAQTLRRDLAYYLVVPKTAERDNPRLQAFRHWLLSEVSPAIGADFREEAGDD
jgi:LysR family glycine cleavage system transcriptional activator